MLPFEEAPWSAVEPGALQQQRPGASKTEKYQCSKCREKPRSVGASANRAAPEVPGGALVLEIAACIAPIVNESDAARTRWLGH